MSEYKSFEELKDRTLTNIESNNEEVVFDCSDGTRWRLYHEQDCCESVMLEKTDGYPKRLIGNKIAKAQEQPGHEFDPQALRDSVTFSDFVLIDDMSYSVTFHFVGESNGHYSEAVYFAQIL